MLKIIYKTMLSISDQLKYFKAPSLITDYNVFQENILSALPCQVLLDSYGFQLDALLL